MTIARVLCFPYPHFKATLTSWESRLDVVGASKYEVLEDTRGMVRLVLFTRGPRVCCTPGAPGREDTVVTIRPSSRESGAVSVSGVGGGNACSTYGLNHGTVFAGTRSGTHTWYRR